MARRIEGGVPHYERCDSLRCACYQDGLTQTVPMPCADGSYVHDFKGQSRCPACGFTGIRLTALNDGDESG